MPYQLHCDAQTCWDELEDDTGTEDGAEDDAGIDEGTDDDAGIDEGVDDTGVDERTDDADEGVEPLHTAPFSVGISAELAPFLLTCTPKAMV